MKIQTLYSKLDEALRWNGLLFVLTRLSKTTTSIFLYYKLTESDFSAWANIYSILFITALWLDLGFSKALPQYILIFSKNSRLKDLFIRWTLLFKALIALTACFLLFLVSPTLASTLSLSTHTNLFYYSSLLCFLEMIKSHLRLTFHSYFWQRQFNLIETTTTAAQTLFDLFVILSGLSSGRILILLLFSQTTASTIIILCSLALLKPLKKDQHYQGDEPIDAAQTTRGFIRHCGIMWIFSTTNSLTERNFMTPFLTYVFGSQAANLYKIANDGALFFQRFIVKTISTTATSLLAHLQENQVQSDSSNSLFQTTLLTLNKRIILLTVPLAAISIFTYISNSNYKGDAPLTIFIVLTISYLTQTLFMTYDRILETKREYRKLLLSLIPYLFIFLMMAATATGRLIPPREMLSLIIAIHALRILSSIMRLAFATKKYAVKFPAIYTLKVGAIATALCGLLMIMQRLITK